MKRIFEDGFSAVDIINGVAVYTKTEAGTTTFSTLPLNDEEDEEDGGT